MNFPLRCACGQVSGHIEQPRRAGRAICYCHDCQAFARFLGRPERTLDAQGGTDIVATAPHLLHFPTGRDQLQCMSLSPRGLLRWYAGCCRTPIGNTPRDPKMSYVGLVHDCLSGPAADKDAAFGPPRLAVNTASARSPVAATPLPMLLGVLKIIGNVAGSRWTGRYKDNPFFKPGTAEPIVPAQILSAEQRAALRSGP